ncbi:hypothetical protein K8W59_03430 [Nocardioides rotundus]|uniref:hypothetical protein n=1 Tax=Nocardioides rotundus TaxID=1774216 RepID=UPI001CBBBF9A|nr:hypothetical protein [Nocardioides rotundus]UAL30586.1 hypothetical protein K8W59_03430 [Nocardioides rotundus]
MAGMAPGSQLTLKATSSAGGTGAELRLDDVRVETVRDNAAGWLDNGCATNTQGIPSCGTYLGATYGSNSDPSGWEREMGTALGVRRTYFAADQVDWAMEVAAADLAAGRVPWISFKLPDSWASAASGADDEWARSLASRLSRLPGPVWLAFHHEPEGDGPIDDWVAMQRRLSGIVHDRAPRVAYTVILTGWHQVEGDPEFALDRLVPEDLDVDLVGFDLYNWLGATREDGTEVTEATPVVRGYLDPLSSWARQRRLPWALAETAQTDLASRRNPAWLPSLVRAVEQRGGKAVAWFNTRLNADPTFVLAGERERREFARLLRRAPALRGGG